MRAVGASLMRGRGLTPDDDRADAAPVALINEAAVQRWFPGGDPLGKRVEVNTTYEVVGVIRNLRQDGLREAVQPQLYAPFAHLPTRSVKFVVRGTSEVAALAGAVRHAIGAIDRSLPISEFAPLDQLVDASVARPRFYTTLLAVFAASALLLAAVGLFGVLSYSVLQRSREIGVRLALGARGSQVTLMVVGSALRLVGLGLTIGVIGALAAGQAIRSQLFGVQPADPLTLGAVVGGTRRYGTRRKLPARPPGLLARPGHRVAGRLTCG